MTTEINLDDALAHYKSEGRRCGRDHPAYDLLVEHFKQEVRGWSGSELAGHLSNVDCQEAYRNYPKDVAVCEEVYRRLTFVNGLKIGTRVLLRNGPHGEVEWATVAGPVTESWCLRLKDGSIYNADINDIGEVERRGIDVAAARAAGIVVSFPTQVSA